MVSSEGTGSFGGPGGDEDGLTEIEGSVTFRPLGSASRAAGATPPPAEKPGEPVPPAGPEPVTPLAGFVYSLLICSIAALVTAFAALLASYTFESNRLVFAAGVLSVLLTVAVIPFFLGRVFRGYGALLSFTLWMMVLLALLPYLSFDRAGGVYLWTSRVLPARLFLLFVVPLVSVLPAWFGSILARSSPVSPLAFQRPAASLLPVAAVFTAVALLGMPIVDVAKGNMDRTVTVAEYGFRVTVPKGWEEVRYGHIVGDDPIERYAACRLTLGSRKGSGDYPLKVTVLVFDRLPVTGQPASEAASASQALDSCRRSIDYLLASGGDDSIPPLEDPPPEHRWSEGASLGDVRGLGLDFQAGADRGASHGVMVYRSPCLYYAFSENYARRDPRTPGAEGGGEVDTSRASEVLASFEFLGRDDLPEEDVTESDRAREARATIFSWSLVRKSYPELPNDIFALDDGNVWIAASRVSNGSWGGFKSEGGVVLFFDGSSWHEQYFVPTGPAGDLGDLTAVTACDRSHAWAGGYDGNIHFYDGSSWARQAELEPGFLVQNMFALDPAHVWAVGGTDSQTSIYFFDGTVWVPQLTLEGTSYKEGFTDVCAADGRHAWAVTKQGFYFFDGESWTLQWKDESGRHDVFVQGVAAADATHVWATSASGEIYFFDGANWEKTGRPGSQPRAWWCLAARGPDALWGAGADDAVLFFDGSAWITQTGLTGKAPDGKSPSGAWPRLSLAETATITATPSAVYLANRSGIFRGTPIP